MHGLRTGFLPVVSDRAFTLASYEGGVARWCPGCGDHAILTAVKRLCHERQIPPEKVVAVSGIGCSGRFPHYLHAYGFHSLHGRALPVASGIKARRPDLHVWVATGDGDCCSIGAGHWLHAVRYNMDITVMLFDNAIYGMTKKQTSPTSPRGFATNTHPAGAWLPSLNVVATVLGFTNVSFVARTVSWNPLHLQRTLELAHDHRGLSFVHILQLCPTYTAAVHEDLVRDPERILLLGHQRGVPIDPAVAKVYRNRREHDPSDLAGARDLAERGERVAIGLFFHDPGAPCYEDFTSRGMEMAADDRLGALDRELDRFAV